MILAVEIKEEKKTGFTNILSTRVFFPSREEKSRDIERRVINEGRRIEAMWRARLFIIDHMENAGLKLITQEEVFKDANSESRVYYFRASEGFNPDSL